MHSVFDQIFDFYGLKVVSKTDKSKSAYVLAKEQRAAIDAAGIQPEQGVSFLIEKLFEPGRTVGATYYHSIREDAGRPPEPRLGTEFITSWLEVGDRVVIGNIGRQVFAAKIDGNPDGMAIAQAVAATTSLSTKHALIEKAKRAGGVPARRLVQRNDFVRNVTVVAGVVARANERCEMPGCCSRLFARDDGTSYLEVHHVTPLAEGGDDTMRNAAALCPSCHRELHFGAGRMELREALRQYVLSCL